MLSKNLFETLSEKAKELKYSSITYMEFDNCKNAEILHNCDDLILLRDGTMLHFATRNFDMLIKEITKMPGKLRLHFVPKKFAQQLIEIGFIEWAEFADFFNTVLPKTATQLGDVCETEFLNLNGCDEVSSLSKRCTLQTRGFEGESAGWFAEWLGCPDNKVIIQTKDSRIVGYCCVSIYNNGTNLWIREMAVCPNHQGTGLGKKLMEQAIKYGVENGAVKGFLAADLLNKNAIALYNKYDFYVKDDETELQMIKE